MDVNEKIEVQNKERRKNLEESVQEMEMMKDPNRMDALGHQADTIEDQKEERMGTVNCECKRS